MRSCVDTVTAPNSSVLVSSSSLHASRGGIAVQVHSPATVDMLGPEVGEDRLPASGVVALPLGQRVVWKHWLGPPAGLGEDIEVAATMGQGHEVGTPVQGDGHGEFVVLDQHRSYGWRTAHEVVGPCARDRWALSTRWRRATRGRGTG